MLTRCHHAEIPAALLKIAAAFRFFGWMGFIVQIVLAFVAVLSLLFAISGQAFSSGNSSGIGLSSFWAVCGIALLVIGILFNIRDIHISKGLMHEPGAMLYPKKAGAIRLLRLSILTGFAGILLALFGSVAGISVLVAKTVSQPPGVAILDPNKIVRAIDVFIVLANIALIAAHLVGTVIAFWLLDRVHHYRYYYPHILQATLEDG
jgi:hypothetical protein